MLLTSAATGFMLSLSLIVAIGAQNAFVLRQGLRREHVGPVVALCAGADAALMGLGVATIGQVTIQLQGIGHWLAAAGAAFLAVYGVRALGRSARPVRGLATPAAPAASRAAVLGQAAAFTILNPHVYLDTVWLVGSLGAQQPLAARPAFVAGGAAGSLLWFLALGYGSSRLAPLFARPASWRWLDGFVGLTMLVLAAGLVVEALPKFHPR